MWILVDAVWPGEEGEDAVEVDHWAEEDPDARVINQEHEGVRDSIIAITIERGINDTLNQLLKATNLGGCPWRLAAHKDEQIDGLEPQLTLLLVPDETVDGLSEEEREVLWAIVEPRVHELEALLALLGHRAALEFSFKDEDYEDGQLCLC